MSVVIEFTAGLYTCAQDYAQTQEMRDRHRLDAAALRFAANRARRTGEAGSEVWALNLERMADEEEVKANGG